MINEVYRNQLPTNVLSLKMAEQILTLINISHQTASVSLQTFTLISPKRATAGIANTYNSMSHTVSHRQQSHDKLSFTFSM